MDWINNLGAAFGDLGSWLIDCLIWIFNSILGGLGSTVTAFFELFNLNVSIDVSIYDTLREVMIGVGYFVPIRELLPIPAFMILFYTAQFVFSIFRFICSTFIQKVHVV